MGWAARAGARATGLPAGESTVRAPTGPGPIQERKRVKRRVRKVVAATPPGIRPNRLENDLAQELAKKGGRLRGTALEELLRGSHTRRHPVLRRNGESRLLRSTELGKLRIQPRNPSLDLDDLIGKGDTAGGLAEANETDQVPETQTSRVGLRLLASDKPAKITGEPRHFLGNAPESMPDRSGLDESLNDGTEQDALGLLPADGQAVVTNMTARTNAAVVTAALAADEGTGTTADRAEEQAVQQVLRIDLGTAARTTVPLAAKRRHHTRDHLVTCANSVPQRLRNDPKALVLGNVMLGFGLLEAPDPAGKRISPVAHPVPDPGPDVLLVRENPLDGRRTPAEAAPARKGNAVIVEALDHVEQRTASGVLLEDTTYDSGFGRLDTLLVAGRTRPAALVDADFSVRVRAVAVRALARGETAVLLPELAAKRLLLEIREVKLVHQPAEVNGEKGVLVGGVEVVGNGNNTNAETLELFHDHQHLQAVARQPRQIVNNDGLEPPGVRVSHQRQQTRTTKIGTRLGTVHIDMSLGNLIPEDARMPPTAGNLVFDGLVALILGAEARVDGSDEASKSSHSSLLRPAAGAAGPPGR